MAFFSGNYMPDDKVLSLFLSLPTGKEAAKTKPAEAVASDARC